MESHAPCKVLVGTTVEEAPSHDGSPTFTAYENQPAGDNRPLFALRVYDTTAQATTADHVRHVAQIVHEHTWRFRSGMGRAAQDRIEVVGLPVAAEATDMERAQKCREHNVAEISARNRAGLKEWYIPGTFRTDSYLYSIAVISRLNEGWDQVIERANVQDRIRPEKPSEAQGDPVGTFLIVSWGVGEHVAIDEEDGEEPYPEMSVTPRKIASLDGCLYWMRPRIEWFYNQYVQESLKL